MNPALDTAHGEDSEESKRLLSLGNLLLDRAGFRAWVDGELVPLTYREFELLTILCEQANWVVPYEALTTALWHSSGRRAIRNLNVVMHGIRVKLSNSNPYVIQTVRGRGYGLLRSGRRETANAETA